MREIALVLFLLLVLGLFGAVALIPWESLFRVGLVLALIGFAMGVPTGFIYHVLLFRALNPRAALPRGWIWSPFKLHDRLERKERFPVLLFCYVGAVGFFAIVLGQVLLVTAIVLFGTGRG